MAEVWRHALQGVVGGQMEPSVTSDSVQGILKRLGVPFLFGNLQVLNTQGFYKGYVHIVPPSQGAVAQLRDSLESSSLQLLYF